MIVVVDTDVLVDHLRNVSAATEYLISRTNAGVEVWVSAVTVMELYAAPEISPEQAQRIEELLASVSGVVSADQEIAKTAGRLLARYRKDRGLNVADALIAATALNMDAPLVTRNTKHFEFIDGLVVSSPY